MKVLFLVPYPSEGASNRIRVEQFIPYLNSKGIATRIRPFVNKRFYSILYLPHRYPEKIFWFILCTFNRFFDIVRALRYDVIFIHREAYPLGKAIIESILHLIDKPIIYDFDDAIFLPNTSEHNLYIEKLKNPHKTERIVGMSRQVIAGNNYLGSYALRYNKNVLIIPSSVDTEKYGPLISNKKREKVVIGWIGSDTTRRFLRDIERALGELYNRYPSVLVKIVGLSPFNSSLKNIINKKWALKDEVADLQSFDIGIMPMPDNEWTRGKCGFKALLCMSCGVPVVAASAGVNTDIIKDGENGFLAADNSDWVEKLSLLVEDSDLRRRIGAKGRETVEKFYSLRVNAPKFASVITGVGGKT